eukprot:515727-Pelagomonas_calceolata.AAC.2
MRLVCELRFHAAESKNLMQASMDKADLQLRRCTELGLSHELRSCAAQEAPKQELAAEMQYKQEPDARIGCTRLTCLATQALF